MKRRERTLGLIVNPVAGLGGRVGLKGSDGLAIQKMALQLGAVPRSLSRATLALESVGPMADVTLMTCPGEMGEDAARACGLQPTVIGTIKPGSTTPDDTREAAKEMRQLNVSILLFAGGDGTARDVCHAVGESIPVLGIPAGVKIHSAVYATSPKNAGDLTRSFLEGRTTRLRTAEVMDIDESAFRLGIVSPRLYGYLKVPAVESLVQHLKAPSHPSEREAMAAIASDVVADMRDGWLYILGPGTTTRAIATRLGVAKTLIGVDVVRNRCLAAEDVNERQLLALVDGRPAKIVVTPIGGQGCIFGRGNQQISPQVIDKVGLDNVIVVSTVSKIHSLGGRSLWVDTGDRGLDEVLSGHIQVVTGVDERIVYRVSC